MKKRVLVVDDHTSVREMLVVLVGRWERFEVVGQAGSGLTALTLCRCLHPDLMILDLLLPELAGLEVLRRIAAIQPRVSVLIYSGTCNQSLLNDVLKERPDGFVSKGEPLKTLRDAAETVAEGGRYFSPSAMPFLFEKPLQRDPGPDLSPREREVLQLVAESGSSKEIASRLGICVKTVENHRSRIMEKLNLHDVASLTRYAMRCGLVALE